MAPVHEVLPEAGPPSRNVGSGVDLEREIRVVGAGLGRVQAGARSGLRRRLEDRVTVMSSRDPVVRAALLRFVDVAPACRSQRDLARHLHALLAELDGRPALALVNRIAGLPHAQVPVGAIATRLVRRMGRRFIVAATPRAAAPHLAGLWERGVACSLDLLGEATISADEADAYAARCADALSTLSEVSRPWPARPALEADSLGTISRANLSVKLTALTPLLRPEEPSRGQADARRRLVSLLRLARDLGAHLHVDVETFGTRDAVSETVLGVLGEPEFAEGPSVGIVLQGYLVDSDSRLAEVLEWARRTPRREPLTVRLVKGAYWDHEVSECRQHGWTPPTFLVKADTDRNFERLTRDLLDAWPAVRPAIASHNLRSLAHAIAYHRHLGHPDGDLELQVLRGLGDDLQDALAGEGYRVRTYSPVGDLISGMAYLVRRLLENSSNDSFLVAQAGEGDLDALLRAP